VGRWRRERWNRSSRPPSQPDWIARHTKLKSSSVRLAAATPSTVTRCPPISICAPAAVSVMFSASTKLCNPLPPFVIFSSPVSGSRPGSGSCQRHRRRLSQRHSSAEGTMLLKIRKNPLPDRQYSSHQQVGKTDRTIARRLRNTNRCRRYLRFETYPYPEPKHHRSVLACVKDRVARGVQFPNQRFRQRDFRNPPEDARAAYQEHHRAIAPYQLYLQNL